MFVLIRDLLVCLGDERREVAVREAAAASGRCVPRDLVERLRQRAPELVVLLGCASVCDARIQHAFVVILFYWL